MAATGARRQPSRSGTDHRRGTSHEGEDNGTPPRPLYVMACTHDSRINTALRLRLRNPATCPTSRTR